MQIQNDGAIPTQVLLFPENPGFRSETLILVEMKRHGGEVSLSKNDIGERPWLFVTGWTAGKWAKHYFYASAELRDADFLSAELLLAEALPNPTEYFPKTPVPDTMSSGR